MTKVFIDGSAGTTGLRINERLSSRSDIELIKLPEELRKDVDARKEAINNSDVVFLCLPDAAAIEAVSLAENENTAIIDTSTAHRVSPGWAYGFPELNGAREKIRASKRIANPGCHASGFIALIEPLIRNEVIHADEFLSAFSLTGYSGGGKKMIAEYQDYDRDMLYDAPRMYGLNQNHKHLPEMQVICGLSTAPAFCPIVAPYYSGMEVTVALPKDKLSCSVEDIKDIYRTYYSSGLISYSDENENGFMSASSLSGRDDMIVTVCGNEERILLVSRFDNLGKGASGAAIQNMNIILGLDEKTGLVY